MKKIIKAAARMTPVLLALAMFCSSPTDKDVKWRSSVDLPITSSQKFYLGAMIDTFFFEHIQVQRNILRIDTIAGVLDTVYDTTMALINGYPLYTDTTKLVPIPDTVSFGFPTRDSATDTLTEDSLADKYYSDIFGPIPLSAVPASNVTLPLAGGYASGTTVSVPAVPLKLKWIYHVDLMDTVQFVNVNVTNNSPANFSSVILTLGPLGADTINNLLANSTATAQFDARAKAIDSIVNVTLSFTPSNTGTFTAGVDNLSASVSFNGVKANKVVALDSILLGYSRTFTNEYNLTDTVDVNYIDINKGFFNYTVTNHTGIQMQIAVTHRNLWRADFCQQRQLNSVSDLVGLTLPDSNVAYGGEVTPHTARVDFPAGQATQFSKTNISEYRMFPEWNPVTEQSVTKVDYNVNARINRDTITMSAGDSLTFVIKTTSFKFTQMFGRTMEDFKRTSDTTKIAVKLPFSKAVTDSLRGKFVLQKVLAKVRTQINIPAGAFIDTVRFDYQISSTSNPAVIVSSQTTLLHVTRDSIFNRSVDITNVVNDYPDSVQVYLKLTIPMHTTSKVVNDLTDATDPTYSKYIGRMILHGDVRYELVAPLCWTVVDTTIMDLGGAKTDMSGGSGPLDIFKKMSDRNASFNIQATNYTNVHLRLYALMATDSTKVDALVDTSDSTHGGYVTTNQFNQLLSNPPAGYVSLLGNDGLLIPPRDSTVKVMNVIALSEQDLTQILNAEKIGLRWEVRFLPQPAGGIAPDALYNTDWIKLNSWIHIDGVSHIDSLLQ